jgi:hypothetical protein
LARILEIQAEERFRSVVDKDQVARSIDHEGRNRQPIGQLANQDQLKGQLGHDDTPRRSNRSIGSLMLETRVISRS